jgi:hypothetical protein
MEHKKAGQPMKAKKVRRRLVEQRVQEFVDAAEYVVDRPLLLWAPRIDEIAQALAKAVAKIQERTRMPLRQRSKSRGRRRTELRGAFFKFDQDQG